MNSRLALVMLLAVAWLGGVALFPYALEPGRSEVQGTTLNLLADHGDGRATNDWFTSTARADQATPNALRVEGVDDGLLLISREIPVFPNRCYGAKVVGQVVKGSVTVEIRAGDGQSTIVERTFPQSTESTPLAFDFPTRSLRRVSVALFGPRDTVFVLTAAEIAGRNDGSTECAASTR